MGTHDDSSLSNRINSNFNLKASYVAYSNYPQSNTQYADVIFFLSTNKTHRTEQLNSE